MSPSPPIKDVPKSNRRRSQRVFLNLPITVRTESALPGGSFTEETQTLIVNAHGALIAMAGRVEKAQMIFLTNRIIREEQPCRVIYIGQVSDGKTQVGVEFAKPCPNFWPVTFPPEDWTAQENAADTKVSARRRDLPPAPPGTKS